MGEEAPAQEDESAAGGQDVSRADSSTMGEEATPVEQRLDSINSLLVFLLASVWAVAGMFFAFKLGGALL
jgi:hypothetical protein